MNKFARISPIQSQDEMDFLVKAVKPDKHGVFAPTHIVRIEGEIVGYFSISPRSVPFVLAWLSTSKVGARDSFSLINLVENLIAGTGGSAAAFPVPKDSPFHPLMESMGYKNHGSYDLFIRPLI